MQTVHRSTVFDHHYFDRIDPIVFALDLLWATTAKVTTATITITTYGIFCKPLFGIEIFEPPQNGYFPGEINIVLYYFTSKKYYFIYML